MQEEFISGMENSIDNIMLLAKCDDKIVGCAGLNRLPRRMKHRESIIIATMIAFRKMSGAKPIKVNPKVVGKVVYAVISSLVLGVGMAMIMAFEGMMLLGMVVGIVGIIMLLFLIPMCVGLKDSNLQ